MTNPITNFTREHPGLTALLGTLLVAAIALPIIGTQTHLLSSFAHIVTTPSMVVAPAIYAGLAVAGVLTVGTIALDVKRAKVRKEKGSPYSPIQATDNTTRRSPPTTRFAMWRYPRYDVLGDD